MTKKIVRRAPQKAKDPAKPEEPLNPQGRRFFFCFSAIFYLQDAPKCLIVKTQRKRQSPKDRKARRHTMYRLQIRYKRSWKWGINTYETRKAAEARIVELAAVGIKARIKNESELLGR